MTPRLTSLTVVLIGMVQLTCASHQILAPGDRLVSFGFGSMIGFEMEFFTDRLVVFRGSSTSQPREFYLSPIEYRDLVTILESPEFQSAVSTLAELDNGCCDLPTQASISYRGLVATFIACDDPDVPATIGPFLDFIESSGQAHLGRQLLEPLPEGACSSAQLIGWTMRGKGTKAR